MPVTKRKIVQEPASGKARAASSSRAGRLSALTRTVKLSSDAGSSASTPVRAKLFQNGRSQAVRLPKEFRFAGKEVQLSRQGNGLLLMPVVDKSTKQHWEEVFRNIDAFKDLGPFPDCEYHGTTEPEDIFPEDW